ncbi:hypothetical protein NOVOSPHI9U_170003 [Novosphingobium sp. 9U]|nr:hypothetical protein NOVOSPHI9U_170003 [Novosphingobium sp. 9U]
MKEPRRSSSRTGGNGRVWPGADPNVRRENASPPMLEIEGAKPTAV